ncbi:LysM peptidoglycan-binding domain-containing protein [Flavobacterium sp. 3HN19-14]|uniref:LysM peptidoglycan-binding domain-containing protein n=1 Tax=Flavobacterium sp. 3HN19-14 TaxID=3448133 RepID=UPI003EDFE7F4
MMKQFLIFFAVLLTSFSGLAQDKIIKHTVAKGETVTQIAEKYKVKPADIYRLNPDSQNGVKPDMVLLIQGGKASKRKPKLKLNPNQS